MPTAVLVACLALTAAIIVVLLLWLVASPRLRPSQRPRAPRGNAAAAGAAMVHGNGNMDLGADADTAPALPRMAPLGSASDVDCVIGWSQTSLCIGDCHAAYYTLSGSITTEPSGEGTPCPPPPLIMSVSCAGEMPCLCAGSDLPITQANSLTQCGAGCDYLSTGEMCYLRCALDDLVMHGTPVFECSNGIWAYTGLAPTCNAAIAECPMVVLPGRGASAAPGAICNFAQQGDTCTLACDMGYSVPAGAVSTAVCGADGVWRDPATHEHVELKCACQDGCNTGVGTDDCATGKCAAVSHGGFAKSVAPFLPW